MRGRKSQDGKSTKMTSFTAHRLKARYLSQMKHIILYLMQINYPQYKLVDSRNSVYVKGIIGLCGFFM